jgi:hypothetical protein
VATGLSPFPATAAGRNHNCTVDRNFLSPHTSSAICD